MRPGPSSRRRAPRERARPTRPGGARAWTVALVALGGLASAWGCAPVAGGGTSGVEGAGPRGDTGLDVRDRERTYAVEGRTFEELMMDLERRAPRVDGRVAPATTEWDLSWEYRTVPSEGVCRAAGVSVTLELVSTYPRWRAGRRDSDRQLERRWRAYLDELRLHERGHRTVARDAAAGLLAAIEGLRASTCGEFEARMAQLLRLHERRHLERQQALDGGRDRTP